MASAYFFQRGWRRDSWTDERNGPADQPDGSGDPQGGGPVDIGQPIAQRVTVVSDDRGPLVQCGVQVALEIDLAGNPGADHSELTRLPQETAQRAAVPNLEGGRVWRS